MYRPDTSRAGPMLLASQIYLQPLAPALILITIRAVQIKVPTETAVNRRFGRIVIRVGADPGVAAARRAANRLTVAVHVQPARPHVAGARHRIPSAAVDRSRALRRQVVLVVDPQAQVIAGAPPVVVARMAVAV